MATARTFRSRSGQLAAARTIRSRSKQLAAGADNPEPQCMRHVRRLFLPALAYCPGVCPARAGPFSAGPWNAAEPYPLRAGPVSASIRLSGTARNRTRGAGADKN